MNSGDSVDGTAEQPIGNEQGTAHHGGAGQHGSQRQAAAHWHCDAEALVKFLASQVDRAVQRERGGRSGDSDRPTGFQNATIQRGGANHMVEGGALAGDIGEVQAQATQQVIHVEQPHHPSGGRLELHETAVAQLKLYAAARTRQGELPGCAGPGELGTHPRLAAANDHRLAEALQGGA